MAFAQKPTGRTPEATDWIDVLGSSSDEYDYKWSQIFNAGFDVTYDSLDVRVMTLDSLGKNLDAGGFNITDVDTLGVDRLEIDGANDWIDVSTDLIVNAAADIQLDPGGNDVVPGSAGADNLGTTALEWNNFYQGDDAFHYFGLDQDFSMEYDEDGNDVMIFAGANINLSGNTS
jgi:hypothetical protein